MASDKKIYSHVMNELERIKEILGERESEIDLIEFTKDNIEELLQFMFLHELWKWLKKGRFTSCTKKDDLIYLDRLDLSGKDLKYVPKEIGYLTNLKHLFLGEYVELVYPDPGNAWYNDIKELPIEIGNLTNLITLNISGNKITKIPKEIGNLTNLITLDISGNKITKIPKQIVNLENLERIDIRQNSNLILTDEQIEWLNFLETNGCTVYLDTIVS